MIKVSVTVPRLGVLKAAGVNFEDAVETTLDVVSDRAMMGKKKQINKTYRGNSRYKFKDAKGRTVTREWKRSGKWLLGQRVIRKTGRRVLADTGRAARPIKNHPQGYAQKLATLPVSKDGKDRSNPAMATAWRIFEPQLKPLSEQTLRNEIGPELFN